MSLRRNVQTSGSYDLRASFHDLRVPFDGIRVPFDGMQVPFDGRRVPFDGIQVPFDGIRVPFDGIRVPFDGIRASMKHTSERPLPNRVSDRSVQIFFRKIRSRVADRRPATAGWR